MDCCGVNGLNQMFAGAHVRKELRAFERRGLNKRQRWLVGLIENDLEGKLLLEIGCGVGAVSTTLLTKGAAKGSYVEISEDYLKAARYLAQKAGVAERASFHLQDFASPEAHFPVTDIVLLDRVVCCYPAGEGLIGKAAEHGGRYLIFSYPRPFWLLHVFRWLLNLVVMKLLRKDYRFFLHDPERLLQAATKAGHRLVLIRIFPEN
jgi:SAM-dependent methyltransferase